MTPGPIRVGLAGAGGHGVRIRNALAQVPAFEVAGVYDPDAAAARSAAEQFGCTTSASFEALLHEAGLSAVVLATPNPLHRAQAEAAFAAGLDVLVEKPIAATVADGQAMVEAAETAGRVLMVGHNARFGRAARLAHAWLTEGRIGEVVSAEVHFSADNVQKGGYAGWRYEPAAAPLLPMLQLGIHAIDLLHYLVGPVTTVTARARTVLAPPGVADSVAGLLTFQNGALATVTSAYCTPDLFQIRLAGTSGVLVLDWIPHRLTLLPRGTRTQTPDVHDFASYEGEDLVAELDAFATAVATRTPPETDGAAGLAALAVVEAMAASAHASAPANALDTGVPYAGAR